MLKAKRARYQAKLPILLFGGKRPVCADLVRQLKPGYIWTVNLKHPQSLWNAARRQGVRLQIRKVKVGVYKIQRLETDSKADRCLHCGQRIRERAR